MANGNLVTGYKGENHVSSNEMRALYQGIFGSGNYVFKGLGDNFNLEMESATSAKLYSGDGIMQGAHFRLDNGISLNISNGVSGYYRHDLVCARYTMDTTTNVEEVNFVIIEGTAVTSNATDPAYNTGDIVNGGATIVDFPMWRIPINGLSVGTPVQLFTLSCGAIDVTHPVGSYYWSSNSTSPASIFGGEWAQIKDKFVLAAGSTYSVGSTGGSADAVVVSHNHSVTVTGGNHTHSLALITVQGGSVGGLGSGATTSQGISPAYVKESGTLSMSGTTNSSGESGTGKNMPPYITAYCWKRTA